MTLKEKIIQNENILGQEVVVHTFSPSIREAEASISVSSRPAWSTELVLGQLGLLPREALSQQTNKQTKIKKIY